MFIATAHFDRLLAFFCRTIIFIFMLRRGFDVRDKKVLLYPIAVVVDIRGCIQKFPDWPPEAKTANGAALCH
jgi:hypothetical protein